MSGNGLDNELMRTGNASTVEMLKDAVKAFVRKDLFSKTKFVQEEDLRVDGRISKKVRKQLNIAKSDWPSYWDGRSGWARKLTRSTINEKRSSVAQSLQKVVTKGRFAVCLVVVIDCNEIT